MKKFLLGFLLHLSAIACLSAPSLIDPSQIAVRTNDYAALSVDGTLTGFLGFLYTNRHEAAGYSTISDRETQDTALTNLIVATSNHVPIVRSGWVAASNSMYIAWNNAQFRGNKAFTASPDSVHVNWWTSPPAPFGPTNSLLKMANIYIYFWNSGGIWLGSDMDPTQSQTNRVSITGIQIP